MLALLPLLATMAYALPGATPTASRSRNCGFRIAPCPPEETCIPVDPGCTDLDRCFGTCELTSASASASGVPPTQTQYQSCGGFVPGPAQECPEGSTCLDDPRVPGCGMACDRRGICVPDDAPQCLGFAGFVCPEGEGFECYDRPGDDCDLDDGGADCIGVCLQPLETGGYGEA